MEEIGIEKIKETIKEVLKSSDLKKISAKSIRIQIQDKLKHDFSDEKSKVDELILSMYNDMVEDVDSGSESDAIPSKKQKVESKPKKEISGKTVEDESSSESAFGDEEVARKLDSDLNGRRCKKASHPRKEKATKKEETGEDKPKRKSGFSKEYPLSEQMANYVKQDNMSITELVKKFWAIARERNLFDPSNRQFVLCDEEWQELFGRKRIRMFGISKLLNKHIIR